MACILSLITNVLLLSMIAHLTFDRAAPNKPAFALLLDVTYSRLVAAAAAQQSATIDAVRCAIT